MPHRIAAKMRRLALKCQRLAASCKDRDTANELEGLGAELAQEALALDDILDHIDSAT